MTLTADHASRMRAVAAKDPRFDGRFITGVRTTGIYCRPSCPAMTPKAENVDFYPTAAAAQQAGLRACRRCRPDATPGSPEWDTRADLVARAMRLIEDGVVDREGVAGLATRLSYSVRQIERAMTAELGAGPLALAVARRAQTARVLVESGTMPLAEVAFAAGFASVRSFNATMQQVYATTPRELRAKATRVGVSEPGTLAVRLAFRRPFHPDDLFGHLAATGVPGVEEWRDGAYRRTLALPGGPGIVELRPQADHVAATLRLTDVADVTAAVARCRRLLDLDADPVAIAEAFAPDPVLGPLTAATPGRRVPRTPDANELAVRIVLGQQVSTAAARTHAGRLAARWGTPVVDPTGGLTHLFPEAATIAASDPADLALPRARAATVLRLASALASGELDLGPGADREEARARLLALPGIGPWTTSSIAMRGLADPDAFLETDLGVRSAAAALGLPHTPGALARRAAAWSPWRSYACIALWGTLDHPITRLPEDP
ncbi:MAG: AlkA N-terminal domain-containing protein [Mobilicoccus sp.]|nr:AlkA N-terminal domain-containing protein [Mobilicoccus sp.]